MAALQRTVRGELTPFPAYLTDEWCKNVDSCADANPSPINAKPFYKPFSNQNQYWRQTNYIPKVRLTQQRQKHLPCQLLFDIPAPQVTEQIQQI